VGPAERTGRVTVEHDSRRGLPLPEFLLALRHSIVGPIAGEHAAGEEGHVHHGKVIVAHAKVLRDETGRLLARLATIPPAAVRLLERILIDARHAFDTGMP